MAWKRAEDARSQWAAKAMQMGWTPGWQIPSVGGPDAEQPAADTATGKAAPSVKAKQQAPPLVASTSVKAEDEEAEEAPLVVASTSIEAEAATALSARQRKRRRQNAAQVLDETTLTMTNDDRKPLFHSAGRRH